MGTQESDDREQWVSNLATLKWWALGMLLIALTIVALVYLVPMWRA